MVIVGSLHAIQGLVALFQDDYYLVAKSGLTVHLDYTGVGLDAPDRGHRRRRRGRGALRGQDVGQGRRRDRRVDQPAAELRVHRGVPVLVGIVIAMDIFIILALTVHGREMQELYSRCTVG